MAPLRARSTARHTKGGLGARSSAYGMPDRNTALHEPGSAGELPTFAQCRSRFVHEVMESAFCWNKSYVPPFKWRGPLRAPPRLSQSRPRGRFKPCQSRHPPLPTERCLPSLKKSCKASGGSSATVSRARQHPASPSRHASCDPRRARQPDDPRSDIVKRYKPYENKALRLSMFPTSSARGRDASAKEVGRRRRRSVRSALDT